MSKKRKLIKSCDNCEHCIYAGEGDFACIEDPSDAVFVKEEWIATEDYFRCGGKKWEKGDFA